jgi:hypothetical protein
MYVFVTAEQGLMVSTECKIMHDRFSAFVLSAWNSHKTKIFILPRMLSLHGQQYVWTFNRHFHALAT